jgi:hypothetical protein
MPATKSMVVPPPSEKPMMLKVSVHQGRGEEEAAKRSCRERRVAVCGTRGVSV